MRYTSLNFILFVAATALVYFSFPVKKHRWTVLLAASYLFYLMAGYRYAAFLFFTTLSTWGAALWLQRISAQAAATLKEHKSDWDREAKKVFKDTVKRRKRAVLSVFVTLNLGILAFLKYFNFFAGSLNDLLHSAGILFSLPQLKLFLPLGISFYTFQSVGYLMDVYNEKIRAERNPAKYALFVSFFPQIIQGPISFYSQLAEQLYAPHSFDFTRMKHGTELILWGFFKKLVIADRAVIAINTLLEDYAAYGGTALTFTVTLYALQLYADFSGGIDISRGVSQIFGIDMIQNFKRPYFATTVNDYWRRWHISLGAWMREYVFYPIALSRRFIQTSKKIRATKFGATKFGAHTAKVLPTSFASLIVFLLVGIWHGASWKYVAFGLWNGGVIMLSTLLEPFFEEMTARLRIDTRTLRFRVFRMLRTFLVVWIGYVFDVAPSFTAAMDTFALVLTDQNLAVGYQQISALGLTRLDCLLLVLCTGILFAVSLIQEKLGDKPLRSLLDEKPFPVRYCILLAGIMALLVFGIYGPGYDPADFVYMQF